MPTRNPVTDEMVAKWKEKFSLITQNLNEHPMHWYTHTCMW